MLRFFLNMLLLLIFSSAFAQEIVSNGTYYISNEGLSFTVSNVEYTGRSEALFLEHNPVKGAYTPHFLDRTKSEFLQGFFSPNSPSDTLVKVKMEIPWMYVYNGTTAERFEFFLLMRVEFKPLDGSPGLVLDMRTACGSYPFDEIRTVDVGKGLEQVIKEYDSYRRLDAIPMTERPSNGSFSNYLSYKSGVANAEITPKIKKELSESRVRLELPEKGPKRDAVQQAWGYLINDSSYVRVGRKSAVKVPRGQSPRPKVMVDIEATAVFEQFYHVEGQNLVDLREFELFSKDGLNYVQIPFEYDTIVHRYRSPIEFQFSEAGESIFIYHSYFSKEDSLTITAGNKQWILAQNEFCHVRSFATKAPRQIKICGQSDCLIIEREDLVINPDAFLVTSKKGRIKSQKLAYREIDSREARFKAPNN